ncbi:hypothetical protein GUITHDRAFT_154496 [Guillardia theta CCMP2712]|uniref:SH3 domain-containing protein n=2 Tax=Guillardia theta TaxID=55529 RepID=L1ISP0_GUITC|nr:hypothetical protein GUITHDRAFT_154496 [Guillardia theta CCMP2712]EKX39253.1 hypothetical protein GUITHDRAFT_154496 [Guillardia theta CCMP2712]|eukprot:XP_005826233.1 hypothetical protein GUITHDRAFT_154496 [Guillardia theta CCMP2712]
MIMQSVSKEMVPLVQKLGLQAHMRKDIILVQVVRDFSEDLVSNGEEGKSSQLRASSGDILVVLRLGHQGWNFGKVVMDRSGTRYFQKDLNTGWGAEGWFPSSYAASVHEIHHWRSKNVRVQQDVHGEKTTVTELPSGDVLYRGPKEPCVVHWFAPTSS